MGNGVMKSTLAIAGEKEYREALKACKQSLSEMKSELDLVKNAFSQNSTSMEAYRAKAEALTRVQEAYERQMTAQVKAINAISDSVAKHREALLALSKQIQENKDKIKEQTEQYGAESKEVKSLEQETRKLEKARSDHVKGLASSLNEQSKMRVEYNKTMGELNDLNREIEANAKAMADASNGTGEYADGLKEVGDAANKSAEGFDLSAAASDLLGKALTVGGVIKGLETVKDAFDAVIDASREFESAFAGVLKTVNATPEELDQLRSDILDLSNEIPMTATEIAGIAEAAGQLGIETDNIIGFTETMAKLGVATDVTAEQAATLLAQFAKVTDMDAGDYERLGSTIVDLGNNFATTESKIIDMSQRLAGAGATVGLSQADILGVAAALSSLGIEAEAGGSAVSKLLKRIETATKTYDKANEVIKDTGLSIRELELLQDQDAKTYKALAEILGITTSELTNYRDTVKDVTQYAEVSGKTADEFVKAWGEDAVGALVDFTQGLNDTERTGQSAIEILNEMGITEVRMSDAILRLANSGDTLTEAQTMANQAWEENIALQVEAEKRFETTDSKVQLLKNSFEELKINIGDQLKPAFDTVIGFLTDFINGVNDAADAQSEFVKTYVDASEEMGRAAEAEVQHANDIRDSLEETNGKINDHQGKVEGLITRIEELGSKDHLTAAEETELRKALEKLNEIMPATAGLYMDLASGSKEAAKNVRELLAAEIAQAKFQANKEAYISGQASLEAMSQDLEGLTKQYNNLRNERTRLQEELDSFDGPMGDGEGGISSEYLAIANRINKINDEMSNLGSTIQKTKTAQQSLSLTQNKLLEDMESYQKGLTDTGTAYSGGFEEAASAAEKTAETTERMTDEMVNAEGEANKKLSAIETVRLQELEANLENEAEAKRKAAEKAAAADKKAAEKEAERLAKEEEKRRKKEYAYTMTDDMVNAEGKKREEEQKKQAEKEAAAYEKELHKWASSKGGYFPKDVAKSIKSNSSAVTTAMQQMVTEAGDATTKTAQKVGKQIADEITMSMQDALKLGNALSDSIRQGQLTVNGKKVGAAGSYDLSSLGLNFSQEKYDDWLNAMYAKGFDASLSGAEIAKILNTGVGVHIGLGTGTSLSSGQSDAWINEMNLLSQELGILGSGNGNSLTDAIKAQTEAQFTNRQLEMFASINQDQLNRERGYYMIGDQKYDYYTGEALGDDGVHQINITNNFNTEVETPATAAKKVAETVEAALYQ